MALGSLAAFPGLNSRRDAADFSCRRRRRRLAFSASSNLELGEKSAAVKTSFWRWRDYKIRYQRAGSSGAALVLIHGFGANCDHWRKNIPVLAERHRVYAIDLLGYGYSDKPSPRQSLPGNFYSFDLWARQVLDFCSDVVNDQVFLVCNSVGGIVGLEAALTQPATVQGLQLINVSLRLLHIKKQAWFARPLIKAFQDLLRQTNVGKLFFNSVATPEAVKKILCECYYDNAAVTDELVDIILQPGLESGAVDVFLDFIGYSGGPLPEEMLPNVKCPVSILWGEKDPWEPVALGQAYKNYAAVEEFIVIPDAGHCPQDEVPEVVNELVEKFVSRHMPAKKPRI